MKQKSSKKPRQLEDNVSSSADRIIKLFYDVYQIEICKKKLLKFLQKESFDKIERNIIRTLHEICVLQSKIDVLNDTHNKLRESFEHQIDESEKESDKLFDFLLPLLKKAQCLDV